MRKRKFVPARIVGTALLLIVAPTWSIFAIDPATQPADTTNTSAASAANTSATATDQITALKQQMALQQKQLELMQKALEEQKQLLEQLKSTASSTDQTAKPAIPAGQYAKKDAASAQSVPAAQPASLAKSAAPSDHAVQPQTTKLGEVASTSPIIPPQKKSDNAIIPTAGSSTLSATSQKPGGGMEEGESPLQLKIGTATITPVAFMDFTSIDRTKVTNGSIATNFSSVPYQTTAFGPNLSEFRLSTENSRIGLRVDANVHGAHVMGYMEADFHGNNGTNVTETTNSNTLRERVYFVDVNTGHFEILGGQTWALFTPGRTGISPLPADIFYSQDVDVNYQLGLVFSRVPELRLVWHPNHQVAWALAFENPDQYGGGNGGTGTIVLPAALASYSSEIDYAGGNTLSTPNLLPDIVTKLAVDPNKHAHFEVGGALRTFKLWNPNTQTNYTAEGGAGFLNLNFEVVKGFRLLTNNFWSDGGGRYIYGMAPDLVVRANGSPSLVHSGSTVSGFEANLHNTLLYGYYGGVMVSRNAVLDANGTSYIGYGMPTATAATAQGQNRTLQEITFGFNQTIWKNPRYGALNFMGQYSYLTRNPWVIVTNTPRDANLSMVFFNLRYSLPGSAPTMGGKY